MMKKLFPLARNASHKIAQFDELNAIDLGQPALLRGHSNDKVLIQIPKLNLDQLAEKFDEAPAVMIDTGSVKQEVEEEPSIKVCFKTLECGHACNGVDREKKCLPCLEPACASNHYKGGINADELCGICYTSELGAEACSKLSCGHVFHTGCVVQLLKHKWTSLRISFAFMSCPGCKQDIELKGVSHPIAQQLGPLMGLK